MELTIHRILTGFVKVPTGVDPGDFIVSGGALTWVDVDLDNGYITARSRKQSRTWTETIRRIELHPELREHLLAWRSERSRGRFVRCYRHSFASNLAAAGVDQRIIDEWMGHQTEAMRNLGTKRCSQPAGTRP